ncbi:MAG: hypothetical protein ABID83_05175 [Candidatus Omnitrophota bacterium]
MRKKGTFLKIISMIVTGVFLHQQILWAAGDMAQDTTQINTYRDIRISDNLARINETHQSGTKETIINIQDCHSSLSAQYSIVDILKDLMQNYNLDVIAIEGAAGYIDTSILKSFPDKEIKEKTAAYLMKEGKISAGEFFSATTSEDIALYGVEDNSLYQENLDMFRDIYARNRDNTAALDIILEDLKKSENKVYSKELSRMVYKARLHRDSKISFDIYWGFLEGMCGEKDIPTEGYGNIRSFTDSIRMEKDIDFSKATAERQELIDGLMKGASREELEEMVVKSIAFEKGKIDQAQYHRWLLDFAFRNGVETYDFPELCKFADYAASYRNLNVIALADELEKLED